MANPQQDLQAPVQKSPTFVEMEPEYQRQMADALNQSSPEEQAKAMEILKKEQKVVVDRNALDMALSQLSEAEKLLRKALCQDREKQEGGSEQAEALLAQLDDKNISSKKKKNFFGF